MNADTVLRALRFLIEAWIAVLVVALIFLAAYLLERWLDRRALEDAVHYANDESNVVRLPSRPVIHDFDRDGHL